MRQVFQDFDVFEFETQSFRYLIRMGDPKFKRKHSPGGKYLGAYANNFS